MINIIFLILILILPFQQAISQERIPLTIPVLDEAKEELILKSSEINKFHKVKHTRIIYTYDKKGLTLEYHNFDIHNYMVSQTIYSEEQNTWSLISIAQCKFGNCY